MGISSSHSPSNYGRSVPYLLAERTTKEAGRIPSREYLIKRAWNAGSHYEELQHLAEIAVDDYWPDRLHEAKGLVWDAVTRSYGDAVHDPQTNSVSGKVYRVDNVRVDQAFDRAVAKRAAIDTADGLQDGTLTLAQARFQALAVGGPRAADYVTEVAKRVRPDLVPKLEPVPDVDFRGFYRRSEDVLLQEGKARIKKAESQVSVLREKGYLSRLNTNQSHVGETMHRIVSSLGQAGTQGNYDALGVVATLGEYLTPEALAERLGDANAGIGEWIRRLENVERLAHETIKLLQRRSRESVLLPERSK